MIDLGGGDLIPASLGGGDLIPNSLGGGDLTSGNLGGGDDIWEFIVAATNQLYARVAL
jgi:hypothetical protein